MFLLLNYGLLLQLKETAERILAVDRAAAMVEEMLKQGQDSFPTLQSMSNGVKVYLHHTIGFVSYDYIFQNVKSLLEFGCTGTQHMCFFEL